MIKPNIEIICKINSQTIDDDEVLFDLTSLIVVVPLSKLFNLYQVVELIFIDVLLKLLNNLKKQVKIM